MSQVHELSQSNLTLPLNALEYTLKVYGLTTIQNAMHAGTSNRPAGLCGTTASKVAETKSVS